MRRLAIIDVAGGQQPVYNEDRTVAAVFNGEIYNFAELRAELRRQGHRMAYGRGRECIAHLYEEYGDELVHHLRGMFASRRLGSASAASAAGPGPGGQEAPVLARGWRPHAFGSEAKSLLADDPA